MEDLAEKINVGDAVFYAGAFYDVAEIKDFPHGKMIGIYDESTSKHIDYINPSNVSNVYPCNCCQGGGCPNCGGYGRVVGYWGC